MVQRTEYRNLTTGTIRGGATGHGESLVDLESYLMPVTREQNRGQLSAGVIEGLTLALTEAADGITVAPGSAIDTAGNFIALVVDGFALVAPDLAPDAVENVPTVQIDRSGVTVPARATAGEFLLVVRWREVAGSAGTFTRLHAPWLRLVPAPGFDVAGLDLALGSVTVLPDGTLSDLVVGPRELAQVVGGGLRLRSTDMVDDLVTQTELVTLSSPADVAFEIAVDGTRALSIDRQLNAKLERLQVGGSLESAGLTVGGETKLAGKVTVGASLSVSGDVALSGSVMQTGGLGFHSGGSSGGYSFSDRGVGDFVSDPTAGQRWVWYAVGGTARLWSGSDALIIGGQDDGGGLDVPRRMRIRQGSSPSAGAWLFQNKGRSRGRPAGDRAFIGMESYDTVGFYGVGCGWGLVMNVNNGTISHGGREFGNASGPYVLNMFGSRIQDIGDGILSLRSGGGRIVYEAGSSVTVNGTVRINGNLSKSGGSFVIDHPSDPAERTLSHSFVEAPERMNLYAGTVVTDDRGRAMIELPSYFAVLNRDPLVQLTPIGHLARVAYCPPQEPGRIQVISDRPGTTISWQVNGIRDDAWARHNPLIVEQLKPASERGSYLDPEAQAAMGRLGSAPGSTL